MQIFSWSVKTQGARIALGKLSNEISRIAVYLPEKAAKVAVEEAKGTDRWKDRSGKTRASIEARYVGPYKWRFIAGGMSSLLNYGSGLEGPKGSKYTIRPRNAGGMLRFFWQKIGQNVEFSKVNHPGVPKTLFVNKAKMKADDFMLDTMFSEINAAIQAHNR